MSFIVDTLIFEMRYEPFPEAIDRRSHVMNAFRNMFLHKRLLHDGVSFSDPLERRNLNIQTERLGYDEVVNPSKPLVGVQGVIGRFYNTFKRVQSPLG